MTKHMNKIDLPAARTAQVDKLIAELCPDGVEYRELREIANNISSGRNKHKRVDGLYPIYGSTGIIAKTDNSVYIKQQILVARVGANAGFAHIANGRYDVSDNTLIIDVKDDCALRYVYYQLLKINLNRYAKGGGQPLITASQIKTIKIPIPPLAIQEEIVKILDTFSALEAKLKAELEAELVARKKQYEYYQDELLSVHDGVEFKELGDVCEKTSNIKWQENKNTSFQYIDLSSVDRNTNLVTETKMITSETAPSRAQQIVKTGDIIFGTTRPTLKRFCVIKREYNEQICSTGFCVLRPKTEIVLTNYIFHFISASDFYAYVESNQKGASYPAISDSVVKKYKIPIPPLAEQERIVTILDKFDALVNDISIGLPAEISARRNQYEYYRNKLLTFKPLEKDHAG